MTLSTAQCAFLGGMVLLLAATVGEKPLALSPLQKYALGLAGAVFMVGGAFLRRHSAESEADATRNRWSLILGVVAVFLIGLAILFELFYPRT
jgi:hypothetical protein